MQLSLASMVCALTACGGGGGGGDDDSTPRDPARSTDVPGNPAPAPGGVSTTRIASIRMDLDHNGLYECEVRFTYDTAGRMVQSRRNYVDDGLENRTEGASGFYSCEAITDSEDTLVFNGNEISTWTTHISTGERSEMEYNWNPDGSIAGLRTRIYQPNGSLGVTITTTPSYNAGLIVETRSQFEYPVPSGPAPTHYSASFAYNAGNQVESARYTQFYPVGSNFFQYDYTWHENGLVATEISTSSSGGTTHQTFEYTAAGKLSSSSTAYSRAPEKNYRAVASFDDHGRISSVAIDVQMDGSIEGTLSYEWESGACQPFYAWFFAAAQPNFAREPGSPYIPGAGYGKFDPCH